MVRTVHSGDARTVVFGGFATLCDVFFSHCLRSHRVKIFFLLFPQRTLAHEYGACIFFLPSTTVCSEILIAHAVYAVNFDWWALNSTRPFALAKFTILILYMTAGNFRRVTDVQEREQVRVQCQVCYLLLARHVATQPYGGCCARL